MIDRSVDTRLVEKLRTFPLPRPLKVMEVCGTHTVAIRRAGIHQLLPSQLRLVSGPGCPVCVTPDSFIDRAVFLARQGYLIVTFGDMLTVPGRESSLAREPAMASAWSTHRWKRWKSPAATPGRWCSWRWVSKPRRRSSP